MTAPAPHLAYLFEAEQYQRRGNEMLDYPADWWKLTAMNGPRPGSAKAMDPEQFALHYIPVVAPDGRTLYRWKRPEEYKA